MEKKGKTHKQAREIGKRKKQGLEGQGGRYGRKIARLRRLAAMVAASFRPAILQKRLFVHNSVCSQFLEGLVRNFGAVFAILFEALLIETPEEIHHFAGWEGGGLKGHKNCEQTFCEQIGVS